MGCTWEKFSSLPAKKRQKFETATGKENFQTEPLGTQPGHTRGRKLAVTALFTRVFSKDVISITI